MSKLYEMIDNEIDERNSAKKDIIKYISEKYLSKYDDDIISESKFISKIIFEKLIEYRKTHPDANYNKTMGLIMYKYVSDLVIEIRDIKSTFLGRVLFFFFKKYMIK